MYRLLIPEMRVLYAGYRVTKQQEEDAKNGVSPSDREGLAEFARERERGEWASKHDLDTATA